MKSARAEPVLKNDRKNKKEEEKERTKERERERAQDRSMMMNVTIEVCACSTSLFEPVLLSHVSLLAASFERGSSEASLVPYS